MRALIPPHVSAIMPYVPGKPIEEVEREYGIRGSIKLASNENPLGPSPKALEAIRAALPELHLYPQGDGHYLRHRLGDRLGIDPGWVILGNGSCEVLEIAAKTFLDREENAVFGAQAFLMYRIAVQAVNGNCKPVPFRDRRHDLPGMLAAIDDRTKLVFLANPNNPTGNYVTREEMDRFLAGVPRDVIVVVDEAYFEYIEVPDYPDCMEYLRKGRDNLLVLRTFSKAHGLAGLRIGYGVGHPRLMEVLHRVRSPFNTSTLAQVAGLAALDDEGHIEKSRRLNSTERVFLERELTGRGFDVIPSVTNFVLVDVKSDGNAFFERLLRRAVIVRPMKGYGFPTSVRVSIGTHEENLRFLEALDAEAGPSPK